MAIRVTITGQKELSKSISGFNNNLKNARNVLSKIGDKLSDYYKKNMESEGVKLLGSRWKELSPATIEAKRRLGFGNKKILERTGKLKKGIKKQSVNNKQVVVGNRVDYYSYHQLGGKKLPKREMLGVNSDVEKIVLDELNKALKF